MVENWIIKCLVNFYITFRNIFYYFLIYTAIVKPNLRRIPELNRKQLLLLLFRRKSDYYA